MRARPKPKENVKPEKKLAKSLLAQLDEAWKKCKWHSFKGALEGLTEAKATWKPSHYRSPELWGFSGSILDILYHVAADSLLMSNQYFGDRTLTAEAVRERFKERGSNLAAALDLLDEGYAAARKALNKLTDRDLQKKVGKKKAWHAASVFIELIEHYLYHAGQVNYIRCLWEGTKAEASKSS